MSEDDTLPRGGRGLVPVPPEPTQQRRRGAVPPIPEGVTRRATPGAAKEKPKVQDRWAFRYTGNAGTPLDIERGSDDRLDWTIELSELRPLYVSLWQDPLFPQPVLPPTYTTPFPYLCDLTRTDSVDILQGQLRFNESSQIGSTALYVALPDAEFGSGLLDFLRGRAQVTIELLYGESYINFSLDSWEEEGTCLALAVTYLGGAIAESDNEADQDQPITLRVTGYGQPNAAVRARVRYTAGKVIDATFDCDWSGGFVLNASRIEFSRIAFAPDGVAPYFDAPVDIAATVMAGSTLSPPPCQLTEPTELIEPDEHRTLTIPPFARRVNLILRYGNDGAPGDAPLGQLFIAFVGRLDRALSYIDAMSAREALFGVGLPIPAGATKVVLSNRSADPSVRLGVIWRLEI